MQIICRLWICDITDKHIMVIGFVACQSTDILAFIPDINHIAFSICDQSVFRVDIMSRAIGNIKGDANFLTASRSYVFQAFPALCERQHYCSRY